jgi:hypothetical protein
MTPAAVAATTAIQPAPPLVCYHCGVERTSENAMYICIESPNTHPWWICTHQWVYP